MSELKHLYTFICKESKIDADTNNLSVVDLYENLQFNIQLDEDAHLNKQEDKSDNPFVIPFPFEITTVFYRNTSDNRIEGDITINSFDPHGKLLGIFPAHLVMEKGITRTRARIKLSNIALTTSGLYKFEVNLAESGKNKKVAEIPLTINVEVK